MRRSVIVVAGGKGLRMGTEIPKQFLPLSGRPVLMHTLEAFYRFDEGMDIILVLPQEQQAYWKELCDRFEFDIKHQTVDGGETRFHSVQNGLKQTMPDSLIAIHDGVRPLVSGKVISLCFETAEKTGGAYPVVPVTDTLRKLTPEGSVWVDRNHFCLVQTPQVFRSEIIQSAYSQEYSDQFTDDVSVVESWGHWPVSVAGSHENIKITTPVDLKIAESLIECLI